MTPVPVYVTVRCRLCTARFTARQGATDATCPRCGSIPTNTR